MCSVQGAPTTPIFAEFLHTLNIIRGIVAINPISCHFDNPPTKYKDIYTSCTEYRTGAPFIDIRCLEAVFGV
jgi:hypothetical protein